MKRYLLLAAACLIALSLYFLLNRTPPAPPSPAPVPVPVALVPDTIPSVPIAPPAPVVPEEKPPPTTAPKSIPVAKRAPTPDPVLDTTPPPPSDEDMAELEQMMEITDKMVSNKGASRERNTLLENRIATDEEAKRVEAWQQETLERHETEKNRDWAAYYNSTENKLPGLWLMGDSGAILFFRDGTGQVSYVKDDGREQSLKGNFFFRYSLDNGTLKLIPILTKDANRKITCHFIVRFKTVGGQNTLTIGPYTYSTLEKK